MGKYFVLQFKRLLRLLPLVLCVVLVLFGSLSAAYGAMLQMNEEDSEQARFQVGMCGTAGDSYIQLALAALETFDSSRFAIEIVEMEEAEAEQAMNRGEIAAYVVIPEGFVEEAMYGRILPLQFVSTVGAAGMVSIMKEEITQVVSDILVEAQKGIYAAGEAMNDAGHSSGWVINDLSIEYAEFAFLRSKAYSVTELGISDGLGLAGYLLCGFSVLFLLLICLPFASVYVRRDPSFGRMLAARGRSAAGQVCCEFLAFFLAVAILVCALLPVLWAGGILQSYYADWSAALHALPALLVICALSFLLFEMSADLISGVLLHFFGTLALCFVSGCLYPAFFFPESVQKLAAWLPTGLARIQFAGALTGDRAVYTTVALLGYSLLFFLLALGIRRARVAGERG